MEGYTTLHSMISSAVEWIANQHGSFKETKGKRIIVAILIYVR